MLKAEKLKTQKKEMLRADVAVIGGGPSGVCAAIAAARSGCSTILINNRPVLGGNSSSEIRVWTRGATGGGNLFAEEMGIWGEIKLRNLYLNPEGNPVLWDDVLLEAILREKKIRLLQNTHAYAIRTEDGILKETAAFQLGTEKAFSIAAKIFIDATGDGSIGALCSLPYMLGKEGQDEFGEKLAPNCAESSTLGNTLFFFTQREEKPVRYIAPDYALPMAEIEKLIGRGGRVVNERMNGCDYWWFELGGNEDTIGDNEKISFSLKQLSLGVWNYIKNSGCFDADFLTLSWEGNWAGKRESRRFRTETILTEQDILSAGQREQAAFYGGWYMDFHPSDGIYAADEYCTQIPVAVYPIPFGCLYKKNMKNLLLAGRDIGVTHVAFASTRIMNTCALSGQAAGSLAAKMAKKSLSADETIKRYGRVLQEELYADDVLLPYFKPPANTLLEKAKISASSWETDGNEDKRCGTLEITPHTVLTLPGNAGTSELIFLSDTDGYLSFLYTVSPLPQRFVSEEQKDSTNFKNAKFRSSVISTGSGSIRLSKGENRVALLAKISKEKRREGFYSFTFSFTAVSDKTERARPKDEQIGASESRKTIKRDTKQREKINIAVSSRQMCGFLLTDTETAQQKYPCIRIGEMDKELYGPENLRDGFNRCWERPHLWMSKEEKSPWLRFQFTKPQQIGRVDLYFNPDLSKELCSSRASEWAAHHKFAARDGMPPMLIKEIEVWGLAAGENEKKLLSVCKGNTKRHVRIRFAPQIVEELEICFIADYGSGAAEVFDVRFFER